MVVLERMAMQKYFLFCKCLSMMWMWMLVVVDDDDDDDDDVDDVDVSVTWEWISSERVSAVPTYVCRYKHIYIYLDIWHDVFWCYPDNSKSTEDVPGCVHNGMIWTWHDHKMTWFDHKNDMFGLYNDMIWPLNDMSWPLNDRIYLSNKITWPRNVRKIK